ncbi:phosphodiester glycosidase family protein [Streptomyces sp. MK7]|uniref:phosphodiester glycosidase family protein n=1 Tax=Streptomyces sp. MK7 TaxID=3067635 RepID=UPI00292F65CF|nr:phosphodiester glycosidase family protein [Streptomyces sp. MK7]
MVRARPAAGSGREGNRRTTSGGRGLPRALAAAALCLALTALTGCTSLASPPRPTASASSAPPAPALPAGVGFQQLTRSLGPGSPVRLTVLSIAPDARARVTGAHGAGMAKAKTVRALADSVGAVAAVNGTYFDIATGRNHSGYEGDPIGLYAEHGRVLSEALNGRPALLVGREGGRIVARVAEAATTGRLRAADGARRELDGVNRVAGLILGCGGVGGDRLLSTGRYQQEPSNGLCTDPDEVVSYNAQWGADSPSGPLGSTEALLSPDGTVIGTRSPAGGPLPAGGGSLYGIGHGATWLRAHARTGTRMAVSLRMTDPAGAPLPGPVETAVGGSVRLLRGGITDPDAARLGGERQPRTIAAVKADGTLLLVVIDGRAKGVSVGATGPEAASLVRSLGAVDAVNLDGGGSATAVVRGQVRNKPRETEGEPVTERPVADAIAVLPGG